MEQRINDYMSKIYSLMGLGLLVSAIFAYLVYNSESLQSIIFGNPFMIWALIILELGLVVMISGIMKSLSSSTARTLFLIYSALNGLTISVILFAYTLESVFMVFVITAGMFYALSIYARTTKKNLSGWGNFLYAALFGLIIALIVNIFLKSAMFDFILAILGVLIFSGLIAYDNQKLMKLASNIRDKESLSRLAVIGALSLYLDFVNLFLSLIRILGSRR
jgi:uncharacterized protein